MSGEVDRELLLLLSVSQFICPTSERAARLRDHPCFYSRLLFQDLYFFPCRWSPLPVKQRGLHKASFPFSLLCASSPSCCQTPDPVLAFLSQYSARHPLSLLPLSAEGRMFRMATLPGEGFCLEEGVSVRERVRLGNLRGQRADDAPCS